MQLSQAIKSYQEHRSLNSKKNTLKNYEFLFTRFTDEFGDRELESIPTLQQRVRIDCKRLRKYQLDRSSLNQAHRLGRLKIIAKKAFKGLASCR